MADEPVHVLVTMKASASMTLFDWNRNVEELIDVISKAVREEDWEKTSVYGPDTRGFDLYPNLCAEFTTTVAHFNSMLTHLKNEELWLDVPVKVYVVRGPINRP